MRTFIVKVLDSATTVSKITLPFAGFLDKVDPSQITKFEEKFMEHIKATQRPLLDQIGKDGHLSEASDKALNKVNIIILC